MKQEVPLAPSFLQNLDKVGGINRWYVLDKCLYEGPLLSYHLMVLPLSHSISLSFVSFKGYQNPIIFYG